MEGSGKVELLVKDGNHEIDRHGDPDLGFDGIGARAEVMLDAQVALDPAEEEFDLPTHPVKTGDDQCRHFEIVRQEDQVAAGFPVEVADLAQQPGIGRAGGCKFGLADLIAAQPGALVYGTGLLARKTQVALGSRDEERRRGGDAMEPVEIHVSAIHHVDGPRLEDQLVEPENVALTGSR